MHALFVRTLLFNVFILFVTLSTTAYTYDDKVKKPGVTVKNSAGKPIIIQAGQVLKQLLPKSKSIKKSSSYELLLLFINLNIRNNNFAFAADFIFAEISRNKKAAAFF